MILKEHNEKSLNMAGSIELLRCRAAVAGNVDWARATKYVIRALSRHHDGISLDSANGSWAAPIYVPGHRGSRPNVALGFEGKGFVQLTYPLALH